MNTCTICKHPIVLSPSAAERAAKTDKPASFYTSLFTEHGSCTVAKRSKEARDNMRRAVQMRAQGVPVHVF